ncbi:MAG: DUF1579 domain-containing protein [bacterium]|jgi:hypothetical protein
MFAKPQAEHAWLTQLVGEWTVESECIMGPDQPPMKTESRMTCRSLGGMWLIAESQGECPENGPWNCIFTIGFDPETNLYTGTFTASMMSRLWIYSGSRDESGNRLILDTEGPRFDKAELAKYQDIFELVDKDHWILTSQILGDDGKWHKFMTAHHRRRAVETPKEALDEVHAAHL